MESILRTIPSYIQLVKELESLKKTILQIENGNKEDIEGQNFATNSYYPCLQELANSSRISFLYEGKTDMHLHYIAEISNLKTQLAREGEEKEKLKQDLLLAKNTIDSLKKQVENSKRKADKLTKFNKKLKSVNADLENFIYSASHDLRSPISNLEGLIQILKNELGDKIGKSELTLIRMISTSIEKFKQTIFDLTELSTFQKQEKEVHVPLVLEEVLEDVKTSIYNKLEESDAEIITDFKVTEVTFSRKNLRSVIFNLLINAVKYRASRRQLTIKVSSRKKGNWTIFEIEDNGLGFLPEQKEKMFQMFKRLHSHVDGTGVGLYIVKKIIENSGGRIEVESELNVGSKFKIFLKQ
ncbi:MAG: ATP-binding protein [Bacteroidota bacterium]|nr:ATP-binding protein [Bacteroidota bacterium]